MGAMYQKLRLPDLSQSTIPLQYLPLKTVEEDLVPEGAPAGQVNSRKTRYLTVTVLMSLIIALLGIVALTRAAYLERKQASPTASGSTGDVPQYFQTTPEIYAGPTATGRAPFLAQTNPAPFGVSSSFVANTPLETALPIVGNTQNASIFRLMGQVSPYFPSPGFGVDEYSLPPGANISQLHVLQRHGSRYPTSGAGVQKFGTALSAFVAGGTSNFTHALSFVNTWSYGLGNEILVPVGRQELFDSGVLHYYNYGHLYNTSTKIIARTTTQDRMLKSAEYFMTGMMGLQWTDNVTLEVIIEGNGFNNSLAGYDNCNNPNLGVAEGGNNASLIWENKYLQNATKRLQALSGDFQWNISDTYNAQTLCPYETVAFGYSSWCELFTYEEWQGFEYSIDLQFSGNNYFESPTGRAVGIGYVEELLARLNHHLISTATAQVNVTLDSMNSTFPLNQTLYFDFSHDTNIAGVLTAFGLTQFAPALPTSGPPQNQQLVVSHLQPFGARLDIEIITAPQPVAANRTGAANAYTDGPPTKYIHFIINQRTLPLGVSFPACGERTDGWCELQTFLDLQQQSLTRARYDYACNSDYRPVPYGQITDGVPQASASAL